MAYPFPLRFFFFNLFFSNVLAAPHSMRDLSSLARDQTHDPVVKAWSLNPGPQGKSLTGVLLRRQDQDTDTRTEGRAHEDTGREGPPTGHGARPQKEPALPTP